MSELVITAVGPDRPGLIGKLTAPLYEAGANVADSRMVNLRGQFALILLAEVSTTVGDGLRQRLTDVARELGLTLSFRGGAEEPPRAPTTIGLPYRLNLYALDQPGLVHRVTDLLQRHGVNVEELTTRSQPRPETGAPLFSMELVITVPAGAPIRTLRGELERLCDELNCDLELSEKKTR
ncbi:MAG TPA: ACT domain-containing protein [Polyangiales bacterium]|nr:ACT domain-containing protein [Polyangiales bacterium]